MAAAKVECVFYGALFLEKVTCARKRFFFSKFGFVWHFHYIDSVQMENGKRLTSNRSLTFEVNVDLKVSICRVYLENRHR